MVRPFSLKPIALVAAMLIVLAACQSDEDRAEEHYQSAMALLAEGDPARAAVEFRNVFQHNGMHMGARANFAAMLRAEGDLEQSYSQYLRLVEQYPDHVEGRAALTEMALGFQNWEEAQRHGTRLLELAPDHASAPFVEVHLEYLDAVEAEDESARRDAFERASLLLLDDPRNATLQLLAIDGLLRDGDLEEALAMIERTLQNDPRNRFLYDTRLQILADLDRPEDVEALLRVMINVFPEDEDLPGMMLRFLAARGEIQSAVAFLRELATAAPTAEDRDEALMALVRLQFEGDGPALALAELDAIIDGAEGQAVTFRILRASLRFDAGDQVNAIADLEALREQELSLSDRGSVEVALAQMYVADGNEAGARVLIDSVLQQDPTDVAALKMQASWLIEAYEVDRAIFSLRTALNASPDDAEALTLMAQAHSRAGNRQLAREFLALAVEASGSAPEETLRYARVLVDEERFLVAEELVIEALRLVPDDRGLLRALGEIYLGLEDWARAEQVERTLRNADTPAGTALADELRVAIFSARGQTDEALAFLDGLASGTTNDLGAQIAVIQAQVALGDTDRALSFADALLGENPTDTALLLTRAAVLSAAGRHAETEQAFRELIAEAPHTQLAWIGLIRSLNAQGQPEAAEAALAEALEVLPNAPDLLWVQASYREQAGDFEGAIGIYERLYEVLPYEPVVANNLASLISTYREDEESLDRAFTIARPLRGSDVPPFQDTFGWISYRRGDYEEALEHLEPAASALASNALVQYHLGMTYAALGRSEEALNQLRRALDLAGPNDQRPQFETARALIVSIEAPLAAEAETAPETDASTSDDGE